MNTICVCGLGAIGSNLIVQLSKQYPFYNFIGIDFDVVEERNIKTQAYFISHVGQPKTQSMFSVFSTKHRKINYKGIRNKIESVADLGLIRKNFPSENYLYIDCFDNIKSRKIFSGLREDSCLHIGFSPQFSAEIIWHEDYEVPGEMDPSGVDICTLDEASSFITFVVSFGSMIIDNFFKEGKKESFIIKNKYNIIKL